jgi:6-phosphogluconate dehydrogenase
MGILRAANVGKRTDAVDARTTPLRENTIDTSSICPDRRGVAPPQRRGDGSRPGGSSSSGSISTAFGTCVRFRRRTVDVKAAIDEAVPAPVLSTAL